MNELVFLDHDITKEPFTTSDIVAEGAGLNYRSVQRMIEKHLDAIELFGVMRFEITLPQKGSKGGRPKKVYQLNEQQATVLITLLGNTPSVREFKVNLVKQFFSMKKQLKNTRAIRELGKPATRDLADAVHEHFTDPWAFKRFQDLAYKKALGQTAAQIRKERGAAKTATANDFLTADELARVNKARAQLAVLVDMGMDYDVIKALVVNSGCAISVCERS